MVPVHVALGTNFRGPECDGIVKSIRIGKESASAFGCDVTLHFPETRWEWWDVMWMPDSQWHRVITGQLCRLERHDKEELVRKVLES